jgi:predicted GTPase
VTPYNENLPNISDTLDHKQPENARSLTFCLLGAPNSGKSTLFNLFLGKNISVNKKKVLIYSHNI